MTVWNFDNYTFVGLDNFVRVFTRDPVFWDAVKNTMVYVGGKLVLTLPIAFMLAAFVHVGGDPREAGDKINHIVAHAAPDG